MVLFHYMAYSEFSSRQVLEGLVFSDLLRSTEVTQCPNHVDNELFKSRSGTVCI